MAWDTLSRPRDPQERLGYEVIGRLVARRRQRLGWSQRYLEDRSGVDQTVISRVENGKQYGLRWARFATLIGVMGGLGDEPYPPEFAEPPFPARRPTIDLWRGDGLSPDDQEILLGLDHILGDEAVATRPSGSSNRSDPADAAHVQADDLDDDDPGDDPAYADDRHRAEW